MIGMKRNNVKDSHRKNNSAGKKMTALFLILVLAFTVPACGGQKPEENKEDTSGKDAMQTIRLGVMYSADIIPLAVMLDQKLDQNHGFLLDMQVFHSAKDRDAALQAGELDGVFTDYVGICIYQNAGIDVKITGITDGDYRLLAGKDLGVETLSQCPGQSIAISQNTLIEYTLDYLLAREGYDTDYLNKEVVPKIPERVELLNAGSVDLGLLPEPFGTLAVKEGAVVLGSANEAGLYPAVSGFLQSAIEEKEEDINAFYTAYDEAVEYVNDTPVQELEDIIIKDAGFPETLRGSIELPDYRINTLPEKEELQKAIDWCVKKGLCQEGLRPEDLLGSL